MQAESLARILPVMLVTRPIFGRGEIMRSIGLKHLAITGFLGSLLLIAGASEANAQSRREIERERQRIERQQRRANRDVRRQQRQDRDYRDDGYYGSDRDYRSGSVYNGRYNRAALDQGYQVGYAAGQRDRGKKYGRSNVYRNTGSYPTNGDPSSADYLHRQGYLQGYEDGYYGRRNY